MSLSAYMWAADLPLSICNGTTFRVLLKLADRADELGYGAYPAVHSIADTLGCSERTVQRALRDLRLAGLIREGDQRYVEHLDARYRPTVYDVLTTALKAVENRGDKDVTPNPSRGDKHEHPGVTTGVAHRTALRTTYPPSSKKPTSVTARERRGWDCKVDGHKTVADGTCAVCLVPSSESTKSIALIDLGTTRAS